MFHTSSSSDYYAILEVPRSADLNAIRTAWKRLALVRHPDKNPAQNAKDDFQLVSLSCLDFHYFPQFGI